MSTQNLIGLFAFCIVASVTPGPNNLMLLASGVNFGFRQTIPHLVGTALGFVAMLFAVGLGLGSLLAAFPALHTVLKVVGGSYLLYLAWKIARTRSISEGEGKSRPLTFVEAAAFQWVNPKAWIIGLTAMAVYGQPDHPLLSSALVVAVFALISWPAIACWVGCGTALSGFLSHPVRLKWFNLAMGVMLVATLVPMLR